MKLKIYSHDEQGKEELRSIIEALKSDCPDKCELIYEARNCIYAVETSLGRLSLKAFKKPICIQSFIYSFLRPSKAKRSYEHALLLEKKDIGTPKAIAYAIELQKGLLGRSYYLCQQIDGAKDLRKLMSGELKDTRLMQAVAEFIVQIQSEGVWHTDLSPGNVLYTEEEGRYQFYLVDLNRMRFYPKAIEAKKAISNLQRLALSTEASSELARHFARAKGLPEAECVRQLNEETDRFFLKRVYRHARKLQVREEKLYSKGFFRQRYFAYLCARALRKLTTATSWRRRELELYKSYFERGDIRGALRRKEGYKDSELAKTQPAKNPKV